MIYQYKGNDELSHTYMVCRFNTCIVIDPSHSYDEIQRDLKEREIILVLLTHAHSDHVHQIEDYKVPIYIHEDDAYLLFDDKHNGYANSKRPYLRKNIDLRLIKNHDKIQMADQFIEVIHTPGHTKGSCSFLVNNALFTGDTLFHNDVGRHDLMSGSIYDLKKSILKIIDELNPNTKVYPGHDELTTIRNEKKSNPFYLKWKKQSKI